VVDRQRIGAEGERAAESFLRRRGYAIVARNFRCRAGEVDLVALERRTVVFVEVKARHGAGHGAPLESVPARKQRRIAAAALHFLALHRLLERAVRFDVVGVWLGAGAPQCELVRDAFTAVE
jgi:putative endonuclease